MKIISKITLLFCLLVSTLALAEQALAAEPRIGLVLSGGGARGLAHIGVLRALEEQGVRVHAIAGTSMGAIVGALYASGRSPDELEEIALSLNWAEAFADQPTRDKLSFRRKQDSRDYLVKTQATLKGGVVSLPKGVIQGQNLQLILQRQFFHVSDITDFDKLPIPFRAVASDLVTGEPVVFSGGSLATAVRASMSIPGLFAPVELDGKVLIDGGVANNLPVDIVKAMGVDYVIAVDIATPLYSAEQLDSVVPIIEQLTTLLTFNQQRKQYALLTEDDLLISPQLDDINTAAFERTRDAITRGYLAASEFRSALARYSAGSTAAPAADAAFDLPVITEITIDNDSQVSDKLIAANIHQPLNEPLNAALLERDMEIIYGYSYFEAANYEIHPLANGYQLRIVTTEKSWGRDLLGVSFELSTDNEGESGYNIGVNYRKTGVTLKGGEWFNVLQLGQDPLVRSELYLPLDYNQRFYLEPYIRYSERSFNNVVDGEISSRFRIDQLTAGTELGTEISNLAILAIGAEYHTGNTDTFVGPGTSTDEFRDS
ncbi:MAG: patatin-like phospholipase family protein, partial [Pseudomonadales bacterium]|nr:patatin-like phospholipase family protein [Pseudomonadales bacterium]